MITIVVVLVAALACQWRQRVAVICAAALLGGMLAVAIGESVGSSAYLFQGTGDNVPAVKHDNVPAVKHDGGPSTAPATGSTATPG